MKKTGLTINKLIIYLTIAYVITLSYLSLGAIDHVTSKIDQYHAARSAAYSDI